MRPSGTWQTGAMRVLIVSDCYAPRLGGIETQVRDLARNLKLAGHEPAVIVSLAEYQSLKETDHLLRNPVNARRLLGATRRLEAGGGTAHDLIENEND